MRIFLFCHQNSTKNPLMAVSSSYDFSDNELCKKLLTNTDHMLHPLAVSLAPQIRRVSRRHCALYKFTYLLT